MSVPQETAALKESLEGVLRARQAPSQCLYCPGVRVRGKEWRLRSCTLLRDEEAVFVPEVLTWRVRCLDCGRSWTLQPPGLLPRKHYQPCLVARVVADYLFSPEASTQAAARRWGCSRRQVGRWARWVARLASPQQLQALLVEVSEAPIEAPRLEVTGLERKAKTSCQRALLVLAAAVLASLEALGAALQLEPPGLRGVLLALCSRGHALTPYRAPAIPILARRQLACLSASFTM
jgi:transposase-like protein